MEAAGATHVGRVRASNQDAYLCDPDEGTFIVADGMGGHAGGEIASQLAINEIRAYIQSKQSELSAKMMRHPDSRILSMLTKAVNFASTRIYERALEQPFLKGMGTTATVAMVRDKHLYHAHVGDSRLYLVRSSFIYQLTHDHSLVSEQVRAGLLTEEEAELHHLRNVITRSVGYQEEEDVDVSCLALEDGDLIVMCSDGLHGKIGDRELSDIIKTNGPASCQPLIDQANLRGGEDNITVVVVKV